MSIIGKRVSDMSVGELRQAVCLWVESQATIPMEKE